MPYKGPHKEGSLKFKFNYLHIKSISEYLHLSSKMGLGGWGGRGAEFNTMRLLSFLYSEFKSDFHMFNITSDI